MMKELTRLDVEYISGAGGFLSPTITFSPSGTDVFGIGTAVIGISNSIEKGYEYTISPAVNAGNTIVDNVSSIIKKIIGF